jgi:hypothetical protein
MSANLFVAGTPDTICYSELTTGFSIVTSTCCGVREYQGDPQRLCGSPGSPGWPSRAAQAFPTRSTGAVGEQSGAVRYG